MTKQVKTALAVILDKVNQLGTVSGGEVITSTGIKSNDVQSPIVNLQNENISNHESILEIDPNLIKNWKYHDRTTEELGDLNALAQELKTIGQIHPCIVRPCIDDEIYKYEVIVGERRWRSAKLANITLKVVIKQLNDYDAALCQATENSNRKDLSEYAKGISYANLVESGVITQKDLQSNLKLSQSSIRNLLSFAKIKPEIIKAIETFTKVSSATAYEITRLQEKGQEYITAIIELSDKIRLGKIGHNKLIELVSEKLANNKQHDNQAAPIITKNGRHIFTWRKDTNGQKSIAFPKDIRDLIDYKKIELMLIEEIQNQLHAIEEKKQ